MSMTNTPGHIDKWILGCVSVLLAMGLLIVSSASMVISDKIYGYPLHYLIHQLSYILFAIALSLLVARIPMQSWFKISGYLMLMSIALLILVLIPGIGKSVNGSRRWIHLGFFSLQVTELVKLFSIIYLAGYLVRFKRQVQEEWWGTIKPMLLLGFVALLLLMEPDFGTFVVISMTFLALLFISGVRVKLFLGLFLLVILGFGLLAALSPYRLMRLTTFLNPWATQFGSGYQLTQSLIAFGRGGVFGVGLGNSVQKLFYLPEAHTDFIFAVLGEEFGLLGALLILSLYTMLIVRVFIVARKAFQQGAYYAGNLAFGIACWLGFQVIINVGVSIGVLPTKGLTLPFISYGGSSLIVNCVAIACVLRIAHETFGITAVNKRYI